MRINMIFRITYGTTGMTTFCFIWIIFVSTFLKVEAHVCRLQERVDPSSGKLQWSLPRVERCFCKRVIAPRKFRSQTCTGDKKNTADLWFVDDPTPLTNRRNWEREILDVLLERDECAASYSTASLNPHNSSEVSTAVESSSIAAASVTSKTSRAASTGHEAGTSDHTSGTDSESTLAESSTNSATSVLSEDSRITSAVAGTSEHAGTTALGSTATESSTNSATSVPTKTTGATRTKLGTSNKTSPTSSISTSSSTTPKVCNEYLGMENSAIPDNNIVASDNSYLKGRLNGDRSWYCRPSDCSSEATTWVQADIGYQTNVSGVITQGDGGAWNEWVTELKVSTFKMTTNDQQVFVTDVNGEVKVFQANTDANTPVTSTFPNPVYARVVRITCVSKNINDWNLRFEILGCK